jgi:hypothetical protein
MPPVGEGEWVTELLDTLRATVWSKPLMISDRMSVSSRALFTGDRPPRFLPTPLHCVGDDLIQLVGGVPHRTEQRVSFRWGGGRLCLPVTIQGINDHVFLATETAGQHLVVHVPL